MYTEMDVASKKAIKEKKGSRVYALRGAVGERRAASSWDEGVSPPPGSGTKKSWQKRGAVSKRVLTKSSVTNYHAGFVGGELMF